LDLPEGEGTLDLPKGEGTLDLQAGTGLFRQNPVGIVRPFLVGWELRYGERPRPRGGPRPQTAMTTRATNDPTNEFVRLFLQAEPRVYGYIRSQVLQRADAEDLLQETAAVLWSKFDRFVAGSDFVAWACRIARFKVQHYHRGRGRSRLLFSEQFLDAVADTTEVLSGDLRELEVALAGCMERLKDSDRDVMRRSYSADVSIGNLAAELGRPVGTIKDILARARRALYDCIRRSLGKDDRS
jgi:RNA polymerase sigma-70 factor, ECF subfamily